MNTNSFTQEQQQHFFELCSQKGVTKEDLQKLFETGMLAQVLETTAQLSAQPELFTMLPGCVKQLMKAAVWDSLPEHFDFGRALGLSWMKVPIFVNCRRSFAEMIERGRYPHVGSDVTKERFPIIGEGGHQLEAELVPLRHDLSYARARKALDLRGLRPGNTAEVLAFGEQAPNWDKEAIRQISVIALGTTGPIGKAGGNRKVLCLTHAQIHHDRFSLYADGDGKVYKHQLCLAFRK